MNWLNLQTIVLHSPEFVGCKPVARATWLAVSLWCAMQENGGRIVGARSWGSRQWQQTCGVTLKEIESAVPLLQWDGDDLIVWNYPEQRELEVRAKREAGRAGGSKITQAKTEAARVNGVNGGRPITQAETQAETPNNPSRNPTEVEEEGKRKEGEEEGGGKPSLADFCKLVFAINPAVSEPFIRSKYFAQCDKTGGVIRNPAYFAGQVSGWWDQNRLDREASKPKPPKIITESSEDRLYREAKEAGKL